MIRLALTSALQQKEQDEAIFKEKQRAPLTFAVCFLFEQLLQLQVFLSQAQPVPWGPHCLSMETSVSPEFSYVKAVNRTHWQLVWQVQSFPIVMQVVGVVRFRWWCVGKRGVFWEVSLICLTECYDVGFGTVSDHSMTLFCTSSSRTFMDSHHNSRDEFLGV
jgi:hypothetical protein